MTPAAARGGAPTPAAPGGGASTPAAARLRVRALAVGLFGLGLCAAGAVLWPKTFFHAYLFAYMFWLGVTLGCLAIVMLHHVTGGAWGIVIRRLLESGTRTLPFMAVLFVPLLLGLPMLYPWARPDEVAASELLRHKAPYLNVPFFVARAAFYFACWMTLAWLLNRWSRRQDETGDERLPGRFQALGAGGLVLMVLTMSFAGVDWVMSLEPEWFSTIYSLVLIAGQGVSAFCLVIIAAVLLSGEKPLSDAIRPGHLHDLGKLLFTFVLIWAYFALSQFLIIWSGNLPEEVPWYLKRLRGGWEIVGLLIILLHFALPFSLLLMRRVKRHARRLLGVAVVVLVMRLVDLFWTIAPARDPGGFALHWLDLAAPIGLGGVWLYLFLRQIGRMPLLPLKDPYLEDALSHGD